MRRTAGPARLALVDDDARVLRVMLAVLDGLGLELRGFTSPEAALELLCEEGADAVISDLKMPGLDGVALCRRARALLGDDAPPFVLHTGDPSALDARDRALFAAVLVKPCTDDALIGALVELARRVDAPVRDRTAALSTR